MDDDTAGRATSVSSAPENDWAAAAPLIYPLLRPEGTSGLRVEGLDPAALQAEGLKAHAEPLVDEGPAGLPVVYAIASGRFDVIVNAEHVLSWGVTPVAIQDAALANLRAWADQAMWTDERSGDRRLLSSQTGDGWDASRILLPEARAYLTAELASAGRVLVALPERHLLVAGALRDGDDEFAPMLSEFAIEQSGQADEPISRQLFELIEGRLEPLGA
jgi:uncharacterized protein YtpQ (UPF0354 family)